jgi:hypothetical protein
MSRIRRPVRVTMPACRQEGGVENLLNCSLLGLSPPPTIASIHSRFCVVACIRLILHDLVAALSARLTVVFWLIEIDAAW